MTVTNRGRKTIYEFNVAPTRGIIGTHRPYIESLLTDGEATFVSHDLGTSVVMRHGLKVTLYYPADDAELHALVTSLKNGDTTP